MAAVARLSPTAGGYGVMNVGNDTEGASTPRAYQELPTSEGCLPPSDTRERANAA